ncbi:hypothetical protein [Halorientalis marina]|uniref:hypothetical protein n=1 Tax=Halorientalis marina TaxID=2931976 RepID=UPI001FF40AFE|nr:hypothetical protein [Halorientalis marina]
MSLTTTLLSGAIGGLVATLGSKWLWRFYSRPKLAFASGIIKEGESHYEEPMTWGRYRVEVSNKGRSVASNCKPRIRLIGYRETTEERPDVAPGGGFKSYEVTVQKKYIVDIVPTWNESGSPTRIDLNRNESAQFDLFYAHSEASPPNGNHTIIRFGDRKDSEDFEEGNDKWETRPIRVETSKDGDFTQPLVDTEPRINADDFREIEWVEKKIQITSADTEPLEGELDFKWDEVIPVVSVK